MVCHGPSRNLCRNWFRHNFRVPHATAQRSEADLALKTAWPGLLKLPTPCYVIHAGVLKENLQILDQLRRRSGCKVLLALKAFAAWQFFPQLRTFLDGSCASGLYEARLGREEFGGELHVYAPAYRSQEFSELLKYADHISFNSWTQWQKFRTQVSVQDKKIQCGLRINPRHSEVETALYDPCAPGSRLGMTAEQLAGRDLSGISGLHFHALCEKNADALERTLTAVEQGFGIYLKQMRWINFGGGHLITRADYQLKRLCDLIDSFKKRYEVDVYLEPGTAVVLDAGYLVTTVLDLVQNEVCTAILDTSVTAHMPDVLEMPYRPEVSRPKEGGFELAGKAEEYAYTYRLGGLTCLAGDIMGDYSFSEPLEVGDKLVFMDMAHYTMVKNNTFNGIALPSIAVYDPSTDTARIVKSFGYEDYKQRLS